MTSCIMARDQRSAPIEIEAAARGAEHRAAGLVDVTHNGKVELLPLVRVEALVAVLDPIHALDVVCAVQRGRYLADDIVETWAETTAGDDGRNHVWGVEFDHLPWTSAEPLMELNGLALYRRIR